MLHAMAIFNMEQIERDRRLRIDLGRAALKSLTVTLLGLLIAAAVNTPAVLSKFGFLAGVFIALWGGLLSNGDDIASNKRQNRDEILRKRFKEWLVLIGGFVAVVTGLLR